MLQTMSCVIFLWVSHALFTPSYNHDNHVKHPPTTDPRRAGA